MSSETFRNITGQLYDSLGNPLSRLSANIKVYCSTGDTPINSADSGTAIGTTGFFQFQTQTKIDDGKPILCEIRKDNEKVLGFETYLVNNTLSIEVEEQYYQLLKEVPTVLSKTIKGAITLGNQYIAAVPVWNGPKIAVRPASADSNLQIPVMNVEVCKALFRDVQVLGSGSIDEYGHYCIHFSTDAVADATSGNSCCADEAGIKVFVRISASGKIIGKSESILLTDKCATMNLHIDDATFFTYFKTELQALTNNISSMQAPMILHLLLRKMEQLKI